MKKIIFPLLAAAAIVAAPAAYARTMHDNDGGSWRVLADANTHACFASNQPAASGESMISGPYRSESQALAAIGSAVQCGGEFGTQ